jgi:transposase-like protein
LDLDPTLNCRKEKQGNDPISINRRLCFLKTRYGSATLKKPQFREFPFKTEVFGRYARVEKALVNAVVESYLQPKFATLASVSPMRSSTIVI